MKYYLKQVMISSNQNMKCLEVVTPNFARKCLNTLHAFRDLIGFFKGSSSGLVAVD